jgi:hypothetical protein
VVPVFLLSLLPVATQDQNITKLLPKPAQNEATAPPASNSLGNNTGTILNNTVTDNFIVNGNPETLTITSNSCKINKQTITGNFVDGNVSLYDNSGIIDQNDVSNNTVMGRQGNSIASPYKIIDDGRPIPNRDGTFTCSFRIQMDSQARANYITVAIETKGLLFFGVLSNPQATRLNPFAGYMIAKVNHPGGVLTVLAKYAQRACNHERRFSWG